MKLKLLLSLVVAGSVLSRVSAEDITTLDGHTYADVRDISLKPGGLFFVTGSGTSMKGVTIPYANLPDAVKEKYHYDPYEFALAFARENRVVYLTKSAAFSLDQLDGAKKKAQQEKKLLGFIMEWD